MIDYINNNLFYVNQFIFAVSFQDINKVAAYLELFPNIYFHAQYYFGFSALHVSAEKGYYRIVKILIEKGINPNLRGLSSSTDFRNILCWVRSITPYPFAQVALSYAHTISNYKTSLHLAVESGHTEVVETLISLGADVNSQYARFVNDARFNLTALHSAVENNDLEMVKILLDAGAKTHSVDKHAITYVRNLYFNLSSDNDPRFNRTPLQVAAVNNFREILDLLLAKGPKMVDKVNAFHAAIIHGHTEIVEIFLGLGVEVNVPNVIGQTALHLAAYNLHPELCKLLLSKGAQVDAKDNNGATALFSAIEGGCNLDIVKVMIAHNAQVDARNLDNETPMMVAAHLGGISIVRDLLDNGADIHATDQDGVTSLMWAIQEEDYEDVAMVEFLLKNGTDVHVEDHYGRTAYKIAIYRGHLQIAALIQTHINKLQSLKNVLNWENPAPISISRIDLSFSYLKILILENSPYLSEKEKIVLKLYLYLQNNNKPLEDLKFYVNFYRFISRFPKNKSFESCFKIIEAAISQDCPRSHYINLTNGKKLFAEVIRLALEKEAIAPFTLLEQSLRVILSEYNVSRTFMPSVLGKRSIENPSDFASTKKRRL